MGGRFRYSRWDGSQHLDDLDADSVLESLSDDLMSYGDLSAALQRLYRWGSDDLPGLEQLLRELRERREQELSRYDLDSAVEDIRQRLQDVIDTERAGIDRKVQQAAPDSRRLLERMARQRRKQLDRVPEDLGGRVKALRNYEFMDEEARQKFEELLQQLQQQVLNQMFQGMKQSIQSMTQQDVSTVREMVRDLNRMLEQRRQGQDTSAQFRDFMNKYGQMFPPDIQTLDQLRQVAEVLEKAGYVERRDRRLELTPRGMRRIGQGALRDIFDQLKKARIGQHRIASGGLGTDASEELKIYEYGDPFLLDMKE